MIFFHDKGIDVIKKAAEGATSGLICTPYYTEPGLQLLDPFFNAAQKVEFWTRFSPRDWIAGVADMTALKRRVQSVLDRNNKFDIRFSNNLHAKIYKFSNETVIIGSANLTWPAMTNNIEVVCQLTETESTNFSDFLSTIKSRLTKVDAKEFCAYVDVVNEYIPKQPDVASEEDEEIRAAIEIAEEKFTETLSKTAPKASTILQPDLKQFIDYCRKENSEVSQEIVARSEGKQSLQGHVKHCYWGTIRFLTEFPQFVNEIANTPNDLLYDFPDNSVHKKWMDFLSSHADEIDREQKFSFRTLMNYIPPSVGGIRGGGGGAISTLKRVLPVVARMLKESGKNK
jgi:hypothetical protein